MATPTKPKAKRVRQYKTADYQLALYNIAKRILEIKPDLEITSMTHDQRMTMPPWQRLTYDYIVQAMTQAKYKQQPLF